MIKRLQPDLMVKSIEQSLAFYRDVLGFEVTGQMGGPDGKVSHAEVTLGAASLMFDRLDWAPHLANQPLGAGINLYITVEDTADIDAYYARVHEKGATITQEIKDQFWGDRQFAVLDPDGYSISFAKNVRQVSEQEIAAALSNV
jgi:PhnB protein